jgi:hypothetical protein
MFHSINAYAIDAVIPDESLDPIVVSIDDLIILRVHVDESELVISEPALLDLGLVVVVHDETLRMEIRFLVERIERGKGGRGIFGGEMVNDDIDHQVHIPLVQSISKGLQVITGAKMRVERIEVLWPVPKIENNRRFVK